ncbi:MAG: glycosyltransferase family 39 protein [Candidatus Buchananbacteria bacterium]|nr:glycosyltransferase family 39 protein [Candidatus Buchananbacteria bacterium]
MLIINKLKIIIKNNYVIILILLLAFVLRIWGVAYGLPGLFVGDEKSIVGGALKMMYQKNIFPVLEPNVFRLLYYPVLVPWILLIFFVPWAIFVYFSGNFSSLASLRDYFILNPENFFLIGRIVNVFFAVAIVFLMYKVGQKIFSKRIGLFSALLYAVSWLPIHQGHFVKHWNVGAFFGLLVLYLAFSILKSPSKRNYILAGLMVGLAGFADYIFAIYGLILAAIHFLFLRNSWRVKFTDRRFWIFVLLSISIFILSVAAYPQEFYRMALGEDSTATAAKTLAGFWQVIKEIILTLYHLETAVLVLSLIGGFILFFKNRKLFFLLIFIPLISPFLYYFLLHFEARYVLLFLPFLVIIAGYGLDQAVNFLKIKSGFWLFIICLASVLLPLKNAVIFDIILTQTDTRILAKNWIENNLPYGSKIVVNSWEFDLMKNTECLYEQQQFRNLSLRSQDYVMWEKNDPESYCVWPLDLILDLPPNILEYQYYIIDSYTARRTSALGKNLEPRLKLVKEFKGSPYAIVETWPDNFVHQILKNRQAGPDVQIYKLNTIK